MLRSKKACLLYSGVALAVLASAAEAKESAALETIVVTASRHETALQLAPASITVVDRQELQLRNASDLADALTAEAGVAITSVGQTRRGISIRGMPVEHTLYLIDGRRISSSNSVIAHSDFELSWLPASAIEQIEVVRGPMSSLYGADALGGVVNVITRNPGNEVHGELSTTATSLDDYKGGGSRKTTFYVAGPLVQDTLSFTLGGEIFDRDSLASPDDSQVSLIEGRESHQGQGKLIWTPDDKQQLSLSYAAGKDDRTNHKASRSSYYTSYDDIDRTQYGLSYQGDWQWGQLRFNAYQSNLERINSRTSEAEPRAPQKIEDQVVDGHIGLALGSNHFVIAGGQFRQETLTEARLINRGETSAKHTNLFLQDEWQVTEPLMLVAGVAVDNHDDYANEISPRLYAVYQLSDTITLKGGFGQGFRAPSLTELSADYQVLAAGGRFWVEGNPELEPERSKTYEGGIEYRDNDWAASARIFENQLENLVLSICYTGCGITGLERRSYQNIDESRIRGLELAIEHQLNRSLELSLNYTHLDTIDLGSDTPLQDRPEHSANFNLAWSPLTVLQLRWRSEYIGKQYSGSAGYAPDYHLHHLDISYQLAKNLTLFAGLENIFDQQLEEKSTLYSGTEPGREIRLGLSAAF